MTQGEGGREEGVEEEKTRRGRVRTRRRVKARLVCLRVFASCPCVTKRVRGLGRLQVLMVVVIERESSRESLRLLRSKAVGESRLRPLPAAGFCLFPPPVFESLMLASHFLPVRLNVPSLVNVSDSDVKILAFV